MRELKIAFGSCRNAKTWSNKTIAWNTLLERLKTKEFRELIDYAVSRGMQIEYELHAASYLLPRELFDSHPEYFRMENGERVQEVDFCVTNPEAMKIVCDRADELVGLLYKSRPVYYFWLDDVKGEGCQCENCKELSQSDKTLLVMNAIAKRLREKNPEVKVAHLAYYSTITPPQKVKPEAGVFLEYAPLGRKMDKTMTEQSEEYDANIRALVEYFGSKDSKVLEYWFDNSMFSKWKKPPVSFTPNAAVIKEDIKYYESLGFENISSFACFLGADYESLYGLPDVTPFKQD